MKKRNQLVVGSLAAIFMMACATISGLTPGGDQGQPTPGFSSSGDQGQPTPGLPFAPATEEPQVDIPNVPLNVIYSDDFSSESVEMETYSSESGSAGVENGEYVVTALGEFWEWGRSESEFTDLVVDVDATTVVGPSNNNNGLGVYCRVIQHDDGSIDGYLLGISADGYYTIQIFDAAGFTPLVEWTKSSAINQGNQTNHIRATCNGSELKLEVNGTLVGTATAPASGPASGAISLVATSMETSQRLTKVHYDNLVISEP